MKTALEMTYSSICAVIPLIQNHSDCMVEKHPQCHIHMESVPGKENKIQHEEHSHHWTGGGFTQAHWQLKNWRCCSCQPLAFLFSTGCLHSFSTGEWEERGRLMERATWGWGAYYYECQAVGWDCMCSSGWSKKLVSVEILTCSDIGSKVKSHESPTDSSSASSMPFSWLAYSSKNCPYFRSCISPAIPDEAETTLRKKSRTTVITKP